ncbi:tetratricopeptide repeat protein [candidate division KSB1 bacterium]|nr:tetratricopeptide repeat protein [candidate division KSB1 bacterium]
MLKPRKRITKKTLKEDKLVTFYFKAQTWINENSKTIFISAAAIVIIIAAAFLYNNSKIKSESAASVELARAVSAFQENDIQKALPLLNDIVENYGNTRSGKLALYYLANSFFKNGDYENALKNFKKFSSSFSGDELIKSSAMAGIAACYEQQGDYIQAANQYEKTADKFTKTFKAPTYLVKAARCYNLAQNSEKAKALLDKIIEQYPESKEKDEAILLKAMI